VKGENEEHMIEKKEKRRKGDGALKFGRIKQERKRQEKEKQRKSQTQKMMMSQRRFVFSFLLFF